MEYYLKDNVVDVIVPPQVTLAGNPAFVEFRSRIEDDGQADFYTLTVYRYNNGDEMPLFGINEIKSKQRYRIGGTTEKEEVSFTSTLYTPIRL